jgi:UDP-N-acetylglucosamine--N-acetylmuramyl-(pentapeptide) pyrophosphoryl-undecaprenol N-acetylglucosamine transferase
VRIVITGGGTGGHLMPALAIADALRRLEPAVEPVLVGARRGVEAEILPRRPYRFHLLPSEPLYRRQWWKNVRWIALAPRLYAAAAALLARERAQVVVGTGGYAAAAVLLAARARRLPLVLQEQNAMPGLTTRWFAGAARQIHLGFPEAAPRLRIGAHTRVTAFGNPVAPPPAELDRAAARDRLALPADARVALVFGGSQGARVLNRATAELLDRRLLPGVAILWGTGSAEWPQYQQYERWPEVRVRPFWDPIAVPYRAADVVVARAGAMTTAELCAYGLPAILVPLPTAAAGHQERNAQALVAAGAARQLSESDLSALTLGDQIRAVLDDPREADRMSRAALARALPDASRRIAEAILSLAP